MVRRPGLWVEIGVNLALLTLAVSLFDAAVFYLVTGSAMERASVDLAENTATVMAQQLAGMPAESWPRAVEVHQRSRMRDITLYAPSGAVLAGVDVAADAAVRAVFVSREVETTERDGTVRVVAPVGVPGRPTAAVAVQLPVGGVSSPAWVVVGAHAVLSSAVIVLFGLVLFRRSLLVPIDALREGTRRIAAGELGARVSEDAPVEIAELAGSLNGMSAALAAYRDRTADQMARLEAANVELQDAQEALVRSEKLASVGRLAAGLAHELGNPLTAVRGYLEILGEDSPPGSKEIFVRAQVEAERMHALLRHLLDFARDERREVAEVDVASLLDEAARTVRHQAAFRNVQVEVDAPPGIHVRGEAPKLHQVLVNLLLNAADAQARTIRLSAAWTDAGAEIRCTDDGAGIAPEHLARLFEPFFTTRPPGMGTGLGLAIAHRVLEQHGGAIDVVSASGAGATFVLRLPLAG